MPTLWDPAVRESLAARADRLTADAPARWGRFTCTDMLAHVNDALRMPLGEIAPAPKRTVFRYFPLKQLIIYVLPFPKGVPTSPELLRRRGRTVLADERRVFRELLARLGAGAAARAWPMHPLFGAMSRRDWGVLAYRHTSHHLTQFGA